MVIDGKTIAQGILDDLTLRVQNLERQYNVQPHLAVIRVGEDPAITAYIAQKKRMAKKIGAIVSVYTFPVNVTADDLKIAIDFLQKKTGIQGIILQLPIPPHLDVKKLLLEIHPEKDVDGFRPNSPFVVPIAHAVIKILEIPYMKENSNQTRDEWLQSKKIVIMGKGKSGGQPIASFLRQMGATISVIDSITENPEQIIKYADILISAVGKGNVIKASMLKKNVILLGIGMHLTEEGIFKGDYDEKEIHDTASWYTPIPGGIGPVNAAFLMENVVLATEKCVTN